MDKYIGFPSKSEYPPYAEMYMMWVQKDGTLLYQLKNNFDITATLVSTFSKEELEHTYITGKWTIKEVLTHLVDDERIYAYRAMAFARNDSTNLPGFAQDDYTKFSDSHLRTIENIMAEYKAVRMATIALFDGFSEKALMRMGTADGNKASVRALGYHIVGHELHHIKIIKEKYLGI
ncbi:MAG: DinB family protein [Bacteroidota bacterium]